MTCKKLSQVGKFSGSEGADRLLDQAVEQALDESFLSFLAGGQVPGQVAHAGKGHALARARQVGARCIDRLALLLVLVAADGVEMFERKAERVDHAVARLASLGACLESDSFARGQA